ncbi:MAG: hypothetical protein ACI845_001259 [Gammaproteobacteria bacterium]|jgi:hypothetical protein
MTEVLGRTIHFDLTEESREIFESIIISRFSIRDRNDEVLRTDDGLTFVKRGTTYWKLMLSETEVLKPSSCSLKEECDYSVKPDMIAVEAAWYSPEKIRTTGINIKAGGNSNIFNDFGAILVPDDFRIPIVKASQENVRHYGLSLIKNQHTFELLSDQYDLILAKYHYQKNYRQDFLVKVEGGGGYFVESHNFPHIHIPLSPDCGGYIIVGKKLSEQNFNFTAFIIPYGFGLYTPANTIHGDGTIVGEHAISVATASADADTVLFYNEHSRAMDRDVFPVA